MPTPRESILQALLAALQSVPGATVQRGAILPERISTGGLLILRDGDPGTPEVTLSKSMENLVGAAGEIHAFRWLQRQYGSTVVSPSNWVSAYSIKAYPENETNVDEGRGCDIQFRL